MGSENRKLTSTTTFRLSFAEKVALQAAAENAGIGTSSFARRAVIDALKIPRPAESRKIIKNRDGLSALVGELNRIGNNINQLAKIANTTGDISLVELRVFQTEFLQMQMFVRSLTE